MNIHTMTRKDFESLPVAGWREDQGLFDSLVIMPTRKKHDSGYTIMEFIPVRDGKPLKRISGGCDVLHIDGIGGHGHDWFNRFGCVPKKIECKSWSIDCLHKSRLLHIFSYYTLKAGEALSSFEVFGINRKN